MAEVMDGGYGWRCVTYGEVSDLDYDLTQILI